MTLAPIEPDPALSSNISEVAARIAVHGTFLFIGGALVLIAFLVNRFAPKKRKRVRRVVFLYLAYFAMVVIASTLHVLDPGPVWHATHVAASLLEAFTIIDLLALSIFEVGLPKLNVVLLSLTTDIVVGVSYLVATVLLLVQAGVNTSGVLGSAAVASAVLALSLQSTLGNILGGVALQLDGSIHVGDWIQLDNGKQGKVKEIRWRHTAVETRDWDTIIVPNSALLAQNIVILGKRTDQPVAHRMWVYFNVDFRFAPSRVIDTVMEAMLAAPIPNVAINPAPNCICYDFSRDTKDSFGYYAVRYWLTELAFDDPTSSAVRVRIYAALRRANIPLARPATTLFLSPLEEDTEKAAIQRHKERRVAAVSGVNLFESLTDAEREHLAEHMKYAPFAAGEVMTHQGAVAHWLYVMTAGKAEVRVLSDKGPPKTVATLTAPGFFGEMGMMTGEPRANDVVAITAVECYRVDKEGFQDILLKRPEIAETMSHTLAERRVELVAAREDLDEAAKSVRQGAEQQRIYQRIKDFFCL